MAETVLAYVALGSNLGDRRAYMDAAVERLRLVSGIEVTKVSTYHETDPVGGPAGQGKYLNAVAEVRTSLTPQELLSTLLTIEKEMGRVRSERFGPRIIDLDVLLCGLAIITNDALTVPHPRMHERRFVLAPLAEIAPLAVHPVLQRTVKDLLDRLQAPPAELRGQNAVVVGSTSGIGRAIALELARGGANVLVHGRRSLEAAQGVARECERMLVKAHVALADMRDDAACRRLVVEAGAHFTEGIDIWIQCSGADTLTGEAAQWPFERKLNELWAVDVRAGMLMCRDVGARMKAQGRGVIVTIGWDQAETGMAGDSGQLFAATKGAVMAFTKCLALDLAPEVRVNCIAPGWIKTAWGEKASHAWQERVLKETPLARWGTPDDVAQVARWLVSPAAAFVTGQILRVNGGAIR